MTPDHPDTDTSTPPTVAVPTAPVVDAAEAAAGPSPVERATHRQAFLAAGIGALALGTAFTTTVRSPRPAAELPVKPAARSAMVVQPVAAMPVSNRVSEDREALVESVVQSQKKRI